MTRLYRWTKVAVCVFALSMAANAQEKKEPAAAELSKNPKRSCARSNQEYEFRSTAEAMPAEKWDYRPAAGMFKNEKPQLGPREVRTFGEQMKHAACANFAFGRN